MTHTVDNRPGSSELRLRAHREGEESLRGLPLPADPAAELAAGGEEAGLIALRNLLRASGSRCREQGHGQLAARYDRTSDLLDIADRTLFQLGIDLLTATHDTLPDRSGPALALTAGTEGGPR
ncbi:hypothetical protein ACFQL8_19400 [Streptomyces goshikiensis]|uniref:hypothetical protein n=1 Tax=Streptomyces goshikiensis TaxID=1942 RepID=UPI001672BC00|nr:hypothetical protein [Streptomyces goshikiensis]GHD79442.1 hypothetical protein GCM10010336_61500 [Streptomyces goshikiensis]